MHKDKYSLCNYIMGKNVIFVEYITESVMNKYLLRGLIGIILGLACCILGLFLMGPERPIYKWIMVFGVVVFGLGFLTTLYSLIRKIERRSLLDERKERQQ